MTKYSSFYVGLDLGQMNDYTAIVILEHVEKNEKHVWNLTHVERLALGTSYQEVARHIEDLIREIKTVGPVTLIVDATGVGRPVIDSLKEGGLNPVAVTVTGGLNVSYDPSSGWRVPKRDLVSAAKVMLGKKELKIASDLPYKDTLITELQNYHVKINLASGHDTYEAWRENIHDDLVFSLCLCCYWALRKKKDSFSIDVIDASEVVTDTEEGAVHQEDYYRVGWVPALDEEFGALAVYNIEHSSVVRFERLQSGPIKEQIDKIFKTAEHYNAAVRAQAGTDEAIIRTLSHRGASVLRVDMDQEQQRQAYKNLSLLVKYKQIKLPDDPELISELEIGHSSSVVALCLVTYNIHPDIAAKRYGGFEEHEVHSWLPPSFAKDHKRYYDDDYGFEF